MTDKFRTEHSSTSDDPDILEHERLAGAIAAKVRGPVDEFREQTEGIQKLIPSRVLRGLQGALTQMQDDVQVMVDRKLKIFFDEYAEELAAGRKKIRFKLYTQVMLGFIVFFLGVIFVVWHMVPSFEEIQKEQALLRSLKNTEWRTPEEYYDKMTGRLYVRIRPGTEFVHKEKNGRTKTFAEMVPP